MNFCGTFGLKASKNGSRRTSPGSVPRALNRRGELQRFPLVGVSIGIATTERRTYSHYAEAVTIATEMKTFTKKTAGSSWAVDVRIS